MMILFLYFMALNHLSTMWNRSQTFQSSLLELLVEGGSEGEPKLRSFYVKYFPLFYFRIGLLYPLGWLDLKDDVTLSSSFLSWLIYCCCIWTNLLKVEHSSSKCEDGGWFLNRGESGYYCDMLVDGLSWKRTGEQSMSSSLDGIF